MHGGEKRKGKLVQQLRTRLVLGPLCWGQHTHTRSTRRETLIENQ